MRLILASCLVLLCSSVASAQTQVAEYHLPDLGLGPIANLMTVELDGAPGAEYLIKVGVNPFAKTWTVFYPQAGMCNAGTVEIVLASSGGTDTIADTDGDGIQQIIRFDVQAQKVTWLAFPACGH